MEAKRDGSRAGDPVRNVHPTVKPIDLCRYLATLLLPPKRDTPRRLLVPFSGSGSEMIGALLAGWDEVVGIEREAEYAEIARGRLAEFTKQPALFDALGAAVA
jgi:site-specific DNA-methyltransferase (adenine-specific)